MMSALDSEEASVEVKFPYFIEKKAPVSGLASLMDYECKYIGYATPDKKDFITCVKVPVVSLCPCSKEISDFGAHNQRSYVEIKVRYSKMVWIEDLVNIAESSGSAPIYSLLKREDEKYITEKSYNNPVFVEDIVRNVSGKLLADDRITWFEVSSDNIESIHNHSAYALVTRDKRKQS
jgi:GTP cyclohydrolase I